MIRVCHVTSVHNSTDNRIFHKECASLAAAGYDVTLVARGESREEKGVHVLGVGNMPAGSLERLRKGGFRKAARAAEALDADVYHIHDPELLPFLLHMKRKGKLCIFDSHEYTRFHFDARTYLGSVGKKLVPIAYTAYENHALRKIDAVIVPCTLNGENLYARWAKRSVLVDNYPRLEQFPDTWSAPTTDSENTVGYVGSLTRARGVEHMIRAAHRAGARLLLAGGGSPEYISELRSMPEFSSVDYIGPIPPREVPAFCRGLRAGLCLLLDQGDYHRIDNMGTKVFEYMGAGLPAIVSDTPHAREINREYDCLLCVDPMDIDGTAAAIRRLLDDPDRVLQMGQNAFRAAHERYNWAVEEKKLVELYRELTDKR